MKYILRQLSVLLAINSNNEFAINKGSASSQETVTGKISDKLNLSAWSNVK